jgi:hypothetical protein
MVNRMDGSEHHPLENPTDRLDEETRDLQIVRVFVRVRVIRKRDRRDQKRGAQRRGDEDAQIHVDLPSVPPALRFRDKQASYSIHGCGAPARRDLAARRLPQRPFQRTPGKGTRISGPDTLTWGGLR